ncbi:MAG TPA: hypothetical protein PLG02_05845 [Methylotenera sp.]|nr:hypothetical protein [Methylotenera sp.]
MSNRKKVIGLTILAWCLITAIYAYLYVTTVLSYPDLQGYEAEWDWQLMFFAIVRLPWLLLALALIIWGEIKFLKK